MRQVNRQPVTKVAVFRRLRDAELDRLTDPRARRGRRFDHLGLLTALALGCAAALPSLRAVETPAGENISVGNRYFVTNLPKGRLGPKGWLILVRMHWRCENEGHWTADVVWKEDRRRKPWTTAPQAVYALSMLRMVALNAKRREPDRASPEGPGSRRPRAISSLRLGA